MEGNPGGAPANVLAIAGKLGMNTGMISKVGRDQFGSFLREQLSGAGIGKAREDTGVCKKIVKESGR